MNGIEEQRKLQDRPQTVIEHLQELRSRIVKSLIAILVSVLIAVVFSHQIFTYMLSTATANSDVKLVQFNFSDAFLSEFRLAIILGLILALPIVLYQVASFVLPALRPSEPRLLYIGLPFATLLVVLGWSFGWFVVVPITKSFFLSVAISAGVSPQVTPGSYIAFVLGICNPLGIAFELPLVVLILARIGLVTHTFLGRIRKFAFLAIMILAAVLSPPDVISMSIFLVPLYGLYEFSILLARFAGRKRP